MEAGLDGFWIHRLLEANQIESHVVEAASVAVSRRHRRAKTDAIDGETLLRTLLAWKRGEPRVCAMVRPPTPEQEDQRRISREREILMEERIPAHQPHQRRGDMLAVEGTDTEEIAKLIMAATKSAGRHEASKAAHTSYPSLDPAMVLFQSIVQVGIGSVRNRLAERGADRLRVSVVAIAGNPIRNVPVTAFADRKNALAAARSRRSLSITSTRAPFRSMAR